MATILDTLHGKYTELKGQMVGLRDKAKAEDRDLTEEESAHIDAWLTEGDTVKASIEAEEKAIADRNARDDRINQFSAFAESPQQRVTSPISPNMPADPSAGDTYERRSNPTITGGPDSRQFASFGEMLKAVYVFADQRVRDPRLNWGNSGDPKAAASGLNEGTPSEAGFLVEQQTMAGLWSRTYETSAILNRIQTVQIGEQFNGLKMNGIDETSRVDGSRFGGVRAYWRAEAASVTATHPKFRQISLDLKDLMALYYATNEVLKDTVALESLVSAAISSEMQFKLEDGIVNGGGDGFPLGFLNSGCLVAVAKETGQAAATITYQNIVDMWARMWARSRLSSVWLINQDCEPQLFTMTMPTGTGAVPVYLPPGGASASPYGSIFGRPVIPVEYCATCGTQGDINLVDLSQYLGIEKGSLQQASSMHVRFIYDEMTYRFTFRFDGQPIWGSALTPYKGTNTLSPFVALAVRS